MGFLDDLVKNAGGRGAAEKKIRLADGEELSLDGTPFEGLTLAEGEGVLESLGDFRPGAQGGSEYLPWGQMQQEILEVYILDEDSLDGPHTKALAKRLRSSPEEFAAILEQTDPNQFNIKRMERLLEAERLSKMSFTWQQVEDASLSKIFQMLQEGKIKKTGELLAIATVASRQNRTPTGATPMVFNQFNNGNGGSMSAELPGPGNLGTMKLTLSAKTVSQLGQGITIDHELVKKEDSIEMLTASDIPTLSKLADEV